MWVYDPQSGGRTIPHKERPKIRQRILDHAEQHYAGKYDRIDVWFRGKFCYIDAYVEPAVPKDFDAKVFGESREEHIERLRKTPIHLCRLRYFRDDGWSMAFYAYSSEQYEPSVFSSGSWEGTPEEAFDASAMYLE